MSCPDRIAPGAGALLLTLLDFETVLWSDLDPETPEIKWVHFHTGTRLTPAPDRAGFALFTDSEKLMDPGRFNPGTTASPDLSTTLVIQTRGLNQDRKLRLTGPGIETDTYIHLEALRHQHPGSDHKNDRRQAGVRDLQGYSRGPDFGALL